MSENRRLGTLLLVEDNPSDEALAVLSLKKANVAEHVIVTRDGEEALDYLFATGSYRGRANSELPAVVLLDLHLPKVNGFEVLERLRSDPRTRMLPVVVFTSSDEPCDRENCYRIGANSYVCKPVESAEFLDAVRQVGLYWLMLNRPPEPGGEVS